MQSEKFLENWRKGKAKVAKPNHEDRSATREHKLAVAGGAKQAVFKVLSKGSGARSLKDMSNYISSDSTKEVITEDGTVSDKDALTDLRASWMQDFEHSGKRSRSIDFVHIALSAPAGEDRDAVERAAISMMRSYFPNRRWMLSRHNDTANPHVHVILQNRDSNNTPLPLRKADLLDYRELWVSSCRAQGLQVEAILRTERGNIEKQPTMAMVQLRERGEPLYFEEARAVEGYKPPPAIQVARVESLLRVAREYADEAKASTKNQAAEKNLLSNHAKQLLKQAKELAANTELSARVSRESKSILRSVSERKQKIEKGRAAE